MRTRKIHIVSFFLLSFQVFIGQNTDTLNVRKLNEVVITAQFSPKNIANSIYKVDVINKKELNRKVVVNVKDLLQQEMNLDLSQNSVFGSSVNVQGISKENVKVLIDGIPVIGRLNGVLDLSQISLSTIERVEIIKGPVSVFYGTDAMGGIINGHL